jgi:hypothetical protein
MAPDGGLNYAPEGALQAEAEEDLLEPRVPAIGVDFAIANLWMGEAERRECLVNLILDKTHGFNFIRYVEAQGFLVASFRIAWMFILNEPRFSSEKFDQTVPNKNLLSPELSNNLP